MKTTKSPGFRVYRTVGDRKRAVKQLAKRGFNYFVGYIEAGVPGHRVGLSYGNAAWVAPGGLYAKDINALVH